MTLQSLHAEVADQGVYVGMLYIGAVIEKNSAFHAQAEKAKKAEPVEIGGLPSTPLISLICFGTCTTQRERQKRYILCR